MFASVRALLSGIIDYAGMFPPAKLPLEEAIRNYARYRTEPESWMLGRFICPAARLEELESCLQEHFQGGPPLRIAALGRGGNTVSEFITGLRADLEIIRDIQKRNEHRVYVDFYEVRTTADYVGSKQIDRKQTVTLLDLRTQILTNLTAPGYPAFFYELPLGPGLRLVVEGFRKMLFPPGGLKIRCGGLEAKDFPRPEEIAAAIVCCQDWELPLKATAGLHHPMRHFDLKTQSIIHGFLNVFAAGVLTYANRLNEKEIQTIIEDEDPKNFIFDDEGLRWKTYRAKTAQIEKARREFITSFGSCSFDEPRDDLRALGLIP